MLCFKLVKKMRNAREGCALTIMEQALYYELVFICNEKRWVDCFSCSNQRLAAVLNVSERSIQRMRKKLITCGLISYRSRKFLKLPGLYSLTVNLVTGAEFPACIDFSPFMHFNDVPGKVCEQDCDNTDDTGNDTGSNKRSTSESDLYKTKTNKKLKQK